MNWIVHIIIGYFATSLFLQNTKELFMLIVVFSIIVDIDHWIPFLRVFLKKEKNLFNYYKSAEALEMRSVLHEFPATAIFLIIVLLLYQTALHKEVLLVAAICVPTHYIVDFFTGHTRPLSPFSKKSFFLSWWKTPKQGLIFEGIITLALIILCFVFV